MEYHPALMAGKELISSPDIRNQGAKMIFSPDNTKICSAINKKGTTSGAP